MRRRNFLQSLAAGAAVAQCGTRYSPKLQGQVYVWTQYYGRLGQKLEDHIGEMMAGFQRAGYRDLELMSLLFRGDLEKVTYAELAKNGLTASVVYNGGEMHTEEGARRTVEETVGLARRVRQQQPLRAITFNPSPKPQKAAKTEAELAVQAAALNRLGAALQGQGLSLLVHQHDPEMQNGAHEWRHILQNTDARAVGFCLDLHWVLRGGQDPLMLLRECAPRLGSLHLRNSRDGVWLQELADGDLDYRAVARYLQGIGYKGYLAVELAWDKETKITRSLEENLERSRRYAESVFALAG